MPQVLTIPQVKEIKKALVKNSKIRKKMRKTKDPEIRKKMAKKIKTNSVLAKRYGLTHGAISWINTGRTFADVKVPGWEGRIQSPSKAKSKAMSKVRKEIVAEKKKIERKKKAQKKAKKKANLVAKLKQTEKAPKKPEVSMEQVTQLPAFKPKLVKVKPGDVFQDLDPRRKNRQIKILEIQGDMALVESNGRKIKVKVASLKKFSAKKGFARIA